MKKWEFEHIIIIILSVMLLLECFAFISVSHKKHNKTYYNKEVFTYEIIYINNPAYENFITLPCPDKLKVSDECIITLDIGIRNLNRLKNFEWNDTQNVTYPEDGWGWVIRQISSGQDNKAQVVDCKFSSDKRKLIIGGMNPGNAVIYLSNKSCGITKIILVTVIDWETWQKRKEAD